jgi:2,3-bisphosphoglycerate-dependent phosphoglycerate mutase
MTTVESPERWSMSDLQCAATFLFARSGEAEDPAGGVLSGVGALSDQGRLQVHQLAEQVRSRRVVEVYSARSGPAVQSAELAASDLAVSHVVVDGLQEPAVGELAGDSVDDQRRFTEAIGDIADTHRGETVLVFTGGASTTPAIQTLLANLAHGTEGQRSLLACALAAVEVDADGWRLVSWPSS